MATKVLRIDRTDDKINTSVPQQTICERNIFEEIPPEKGKGVAAGKGSWIGKSINKKSAVTADQSNIVVIPPAFKEQEQVDQPISSSAEGEPDEKNIFLHYLRKFSNEKNDENCEEFLNAAFEVGKIAGFSKEERIEIGSKLAETAEFIFLFLFHFGLNFDTEYGLLLFKYRSALEFILKDYRSFPIDNNGVQLSFTLDEIEKKSDTLKVLDKAVKYLTQKVNHATVFEGYTSEDLLRPECIPAKHSWWLNKMKNRSKKQKF